MPKTTLSIDSQRVDDLPIILEYCKQLGVAEAIDEVFGTAHGNRTGLSYGQLALGWIAAIGAQGDHRLNRMEEWSMAHRPTLEASLGSPVGDKDFTDDRLTDLLWELGEPSGQMAAEIEERVGQRMVKAYQLPTEVGRADTTSVTVYHDREEEKGFLAYGKSKDHRPDLRQFVEAMGTLDPAGAPLATSALPGNRADDTMYWPMWERMTRVIGHARWLYVGDSKLHSAQTLARIHRAQGLFLTPLPMKGTIPEEFEQWLKAAPSELVAVRLPDAKGQLRVVGHGFEVERRIPWVDPDNGERISVPERVFVVRRESFAQQQVRDLMRRLERAEEAVKSRNGQRIKDPSSFEAEIQAVVTGHEVSGFLTATIHWSKEREEKYVGRGRPGPDTPKRVIEHHRAHVSVRRDEKAIQAFEKQAGWRAYGTNASPERLTLQAAVETYSGEFRIEHGFHRLKGGLLQVAPIFLRTDQHIRGLLLLVAMALRVLTLVEFVARRSLETEKAILKGLFARGGAPKKETARPTVERLLEAFKGVTLSTVRIGGEVHRQLTPLSPLHQDILRHIGLSPDIYLRLEAGETKFETPAKK